MEIVIIFLVALLAAVMTFSIKTLKRLSGYQDIVENLPDPGHACCVGFLRTYIVQLRLQRSTRLLKSRGVYTRVQSTPTSTSAEFLPNMAPI